MKQYLTAIICGSLLCTPLEAHHSETELTWTNPTHNEDGTLLTDLRQIRIDWGCVQSGLYDNFIIIPSIPDPQVIPPETITIGGLIDSGNCYFVGRAINSQDEISVYSGEAMKSFNLPATPKSPGSLILSGEPPIHLYELSNTDFTGTPVVAGNWNIPGQALDISFEITPRSLINDGRIISKAVNTSEQGHYFMVSEHSDALRFRLKTNGITTTLLGTTTLPLNVKTSGQVTYDGVNMQIYINGVLDASVPKTGDIDQSNAEVWVGGNPPDNSGPWEGEISITVN